MAQTDRIAGYTGDIAVKIPCRVATTAAITLSGTQTVDGVALAAGDRVLVKDQTSSVENGIYVVQTGAWTRAVDFDGARDATKGTQVFADEGTVNEGRFYRVATAGVLTPGATAITFSETPGGVSSATAAAASAAAAALSEASAAADAASTAADALSTAADATSTAADVLSSAASASAAAASAANLPNAPTAGASKYIKSNATADGWDYKTSADVAQEVIDTTHAATSKTTPVDADELAIVDSAASNVLKKLTWANLKATLLGVTAGKAQQVDQSVTATTRAATTTLGTTLNHTLSATGVAITAFNGVAGVTYRCTALGTGLITYHATNLIIKQGLSSIETAAGDTFDVYMLTATTCEVRNYVRASIPGRGAIAGATFSITSGALTVHSSFGGCVMSKSDVGRYYAGPPVLPTNYAVAVNHVPSLGIAGLGWYYLKSDGILYMVENSTYIDVAGPTAPSSIVFFEV